MTIAQFQDKYQNYQTYSEEIARVEAMKANDEGLEDEALAVCFPGTRAWTIMLRKPYMLLVEAGVLS